METTSATLLERVRDAEDAPAWREFFELYFPLLKRYARRRGLAEADAEEVAQDCMQTLARRMHSLEYDPARGHFRGYLRTMVERRIIDQHRRRAACQARTGELDRMPAAEESQALWERLWLREHLRYCLSRLETRYSRQTVAAFELYVLREWPVERVCAELGLSANQVYLAKTRIGRKLRLALGDLVGEAE